MNTISLRPLRWQLGVTAMLALLCALGTGIGLTFQPTNRAARQVQFAPRPLPRRPATPDTAEAFKALNQEETHINSELKKLTDTELPSLESQIKQSKQLAQSADIPELKKLTELRKKPPLWENLGLDSQRRQEVIVVWGSPEITDEQVGQAITVLNSRRDHYIQQATSGVENRTQTQKRLTALRDKFETDRQSQLATLVLDALNDTEINTLLAKIKDLFSGGIRAVAGENFTNSVGIEMVWVPEGGFWIGRTELTEVQFFRGYGIQRGSTDLKDEVLFDGALGFVKNLNTLENREKAPDIAGALLRPVDASYGLPTIRQWNDAKAKGEGILGFDNDLHEWTSTKHGEGGSSLPKNVTAGKILGVDNWPVAMQRNSPISLEPNTNHNMTTKPVGSTISVLWSGRLGFRVILIPAGQ